MIYIGLKCFESMQQFCGFYNTLGYVSIYNPISFNSAVLSRGRNQRLESSSLKILFLAGCACARMRRTTECVPYGRPLWHGSRCCPNEIGLQEEPAVAPVTQADYL